MAEPKIDSNPQNQSLIFVIAVSLLVVGLGVPAFSWLFFPKKVTPEEIVLAVDPGRSRSPASVGTSVSPALIVFDCRKVETINQVVVSQSRHVRVKTENCEGHHLEDFTLENTSNGFVASFVQLPNQNFTTDFVEVQNGENKLILKNSKIPELSQGITFQVTSRSPASVTE